MRFYWLTLGILGVWRITNLLQAEDGPGDIMAHLRRKAGTGFWGKLLDCFYCLSIWTAVPFALFIGQGWRERLILWPAFSAGAILLERLTNPGRAMPPPAFYVEDEDQDAVLRESESEASRPDQS
ncbi:MAG: DUF1360 domain-containing protein [Pyrinomonadaceae bacterium]